MNVDGHDLNLRNFEFEFLRNLVSYLDKTAPNFVRIENWSPIFRIPNDVIVTAIHNMIVGLIPDVIVIYGL